MSRLKKRLKKAALAGAALYGASKLGMFGKTPVGSSGVVGKTPEFRKSFVKDKPILGKTKDFRKSFTTGKTKSEFPKLKVTSTGDVIKDGVNTGVGNKKTLFVNRDPEVGSIGIYKGGKKVSDLNPKAINVLSDGKISAKGKIFDGKKEYRKFMDAERAKKRASSGGGGFKNFMNKFILGEKTQMKVGKMVKARGGGMARTKPTKMY